MKYTKNKTITEDQKLMLLGLLTVAHTHTQALRDIITSGEKILIPLEPENYGHWPDAVWGDTGLEELLRFEEISVEGL